jgi:hypothetical protein
VVEVLVDPTLTPPHPPPRFAAPLAAKEAENAGRGYIGPP